MNTKIEVLKTTTYELTTPEGKVVVNVPAVIGEDYDGEVNLFVGLSGRVIVMYEAEDRRCHYQFRDPRRGGDVATYGRAAIIAYEIARHLEEGVEITTAILGTLSGVEAVGK